MSKSRFMIATAASVGIVRDGKKVIVQPGGGADFTEDEITTINRILPGSLRAPVNEGRGVAVAADEDEDGGEDAKAPAAKKTSGGKAKAKAKTEPKPVEDDADEDEDI